MEDKSDEAVDEVPPDYDAIKDILDRELNEIIIDSIPKTTGTAPTTTESVRMSTNPSAKRLSGNSNKTPGRQNDKMRITTSSEGLNQWKKAFGKLNDVTEKDILLEEESILTESKNNRNLLTNYDTAAQKQDSVVTVDVEADKQNNKSKFILMNLFQRYD